MKYSVIVLLEERHEDFTKFIHNLYEIFSNSQLPFEIIIVANGLGGFLRNKLTDLKEVKHKLRALELRRGMTQAVCLNSAFKETRGEIIAVFGSYQQITNDSLVKLLNSFDNEIDILSPWRQNRVDPALNRIQSKVFNLLVRMLVKTKLHDLSCTVKIFKRRVLEETVVYGNMYRFLPIVAIQRGFKTKEIKCEHYQERGKSGFYYLSDYVTRIIDIITLYFNTRFIKKPLRFFSSLGLAFMIFGIFSNVIVFLQKIFIHKPIGNHPLLFIGILLMVLGVQVAGVGLLGEIIVYTHGRFKKGYTIEKII